MLLIRLAFRNIFRQARRTLLTMLSMTGGYVLCAAAISLQSGSYANAIGFFVGDHTGHIQVHEGNYLQRPRIHHSIANPDAIVSIIEKNNEIAASTTRVFAPSLAYGTDKTTPANVIGIDVELEATTSTLKMKVSEGEYLKSEPDSDGYFDAMIGRGIADLLKIGVGDELVLISAGADGSIANDIFMVRGLIGSLRSPDRLNVYLPLGAAQEFLSLGDRVHEFSILINNIEESIEVARELGEAFPDSLSVDPWEQVEAAFYRSMAANRQGTYVALALIVFIVCIGVLNTVWMSVFERTREFGILRAIGTRPGRISTMVLLEIAILSLLSCALGFLLTLPVVGFITLVGFELPEPVEIGGVFMSHLRGEFTMKVFTIPLAFVVTTAVLVSIPPGLRAASITPIEALGSH